MRFDWQTGFTTLSEEDKIDSTVNFERMNSVFYAYAHMRMRGRSNMVFII